ncbi:MAG TPA: TetR/AcrR family transcriptional regulator [Jatrophihabitantaceae bacterium]
MGDVNDELSRRLIDEAARLLAEEGPAGLSVRKLASAAGTSTMAIYSRFGDKPSLLAAMHREGFRRLGAHLQVTATDPETALVELGRAYRRSALQSPHLYALMFGPRPPGFRPGEDDDKAADATYAPLVEAVRAAVQDGLLDGDPERIARQLWVVAHGMVSLELAGHLALSGESAADAYDEALLCAVQPFVSRKHEGRAADSRVPRGALVTSCGSWLAGRHGGQCALQRVQLPDGCGVVDPLIDGADER